MGKNLHMHMLHLQLAISALAEICHRKNKDFPNVDFHATVLLMNIAVAMTIKQVGFRLDSDLRVSINV